jgi:N-acyl amino acid synthase of PEP-CTERM/exosortase system
MCAIIHNQSQFIPDELNKLASPDREAIHFLNDVIDRHFDVFEATTEEAVWACQELRYKIYCAENQYEDPRIHRQGLETDERDSHAVHAIAIHRATGHPIATVRLILCDTLGDGERLSFEDNCSEPSPFVRFGDHGVHIGEISRFGISRTARGQLRDLCRKNLGGRQTADPFTWENSRQLSNILLMLPIRGFILLAAKYGVTHYCALTAPGLLRRLAMFGIHFDLIGDLVEHHGVRQPNVIAVDALLARVKRERPEVWTVIGGDRLGLDADLTPVAAE